MIKKDSGNFIKLLQKKKWFLLKVYLLLSFQLFITYGIVYYFRTNKKLSDITDIPILYYIILSALLIIALIYSKSSPIWFRILLFMLYSIVTGGLLHNMSKYVPAEFITKILLSAISLFIGISIIATILAYIGIDLGWMYLYIIFAMMALIIGYIAILFIEDEALKKSVYKYVLIAGLIVFSFDILYSTNIMLNKDYIDYIDASLDLYLGIINLFTKLFALESIE